MSDKEDQSLAKATKGSSGWGTFGEGPTTAAAAAAAAAASTRNKSGSTTSTPASKSPTTAKRSRMRARINSGDLLLQQSPDGLVMSPAMRRRREIVGKGLTSLKETAGGGMRTIMGLGTASNRDTPFRKGVSYERLSEADSSGTMMDDASSDGGSRRTRQRSSTWDEHGIAKQQEQKRAGMGHPGVGGEGEGEGGGRGRTWSHHGAYGHHGQDSRHSTEWEHLDGFQAMGSMFQQELYHEKSSGLAEVLADRLRVPLLIILVGILAALAGMVVDYTSSWARIWRIDQTATHSDLSLAWLVYGATSLTLTLGMCAVTHFACPCAAGGGVPEMKAVLSGASRPGLLSVRLVIVKAMGVIAANAAGLSVGKEGPLIHITCAMADILMSTSWFRKVRLNNMQRLGILACACAAGVAATFGSVFGGTLFSVEVTATAYMVDTLPATFLCAVVVAVVYWASGNSELFTLISDETAQAQGFTRTDLLAWGLLGAVCGLVGAFFVAVLDALSIRRNFFTRKELSPSTRKLRMFVIVALATLLVIPASYTEAIAFSVDDPRGRAKFHPLIDRIYDQQEFGMSWHLLQLLLLKFWATIFSVVQPLPVGLFSPIFVIGGLMGRIFGEMAQWMDHYVDSVTINFQPWEFALIGSAAFSAGVTRAVSTAVIVFELSGENHLRLPLGVALMISYFIANRFTKGVYDALMDTNGTPHLEEVPPEDRNVPAEDVMVPVDELPCLSLNCTGKDASDIISLSQPGQVIPVVQSMSDKVLVGVVLWNDLAIALADYRRRGSAMANNRRRSNGGLSPSFPSSTWRGGGHAYDGIGSPETAAAAAASTGKLDKFEWEEASSEEGGSVVEEDGDEGGGSLWPGLAGVAKAVGQRVGWFPRMRLAEASLLQELDRQRAESAEGNQADAFYPTQAGREDQDHYEHEHDTPLPPLGEGIPYGASPGASPGWGETKNGGSAAPAAAAADLPHVGSSPTTHNGHFTPSSTSAGTQDRLLGASNAANTLEKAASSTGGFALGVTAAAGGRLGGRSPVRGATRPFALTAVERAKRAPLRFFLVREGNKFVAVGRTLTKGTWRELPEVLASTVVPAASYGIPVVLDPSPYQVTHTTELSKVDIAFRLLKLDNAYVCNAGRLVGMITRENLADFVDQREVSPMDDCVRLCGAFACCMPRAGAKAGNTADEGKGGRRGSRGRLPRPNVSDIPTSAVTARDEYPSQRTAQQVTGKREGGGDAFGGGTWDPV